MKVFYRRLPELAICLVLSVLTIVAHNIAPATAHDGHDHAAEATCPAAQLYCPAQAANILTPKLSTLTIPAVQPPQPPQIEVKVAQKTVTYSVETRGVITADLAIFKKYAKETYQDGRGWAQLGATFSEVPTGGSFTLVLAEASQVPTFSSGCDASYSCAVGRYVIINQDRWLGATVPWNTAGGSLRNYQHMVVNHETGHWLGHGHEGCGGAGQLAPVMQQQSIDLQGCAFNPWPLKSELWSTRLGINV